MGPAVQEEITEAPAQPVRPSTTSWLVRHRIPLVATYFVASGVTVAVVGLPERQYVWIWLLGAVLLACVHSPHPVARVIIDWIPVLVILAGYDFVRGFASDLIPRAVVEPQLRFDEIAFGGTVPTALLQNWLEVDDTPHPWDYAVFCYYLSHFVVTPSFALYFYLRDRERFRRFAMVVLTVSLAGFATYFALPAVPPWLASQAPYNDLEPTVRVVHSVWEQLGATGAAEVFAGDTKLANPVAALPSLHAAWPFLVLMFVWRRAPRGRWLALAYNAGMVFVLVYGAEHYVSDIVLGWLYAVLGFLVVNGLIDRRDTRTGRVTTATASG